MIDKKRKRANEPSTQRKQKKVTIEEPASSSSFPQSIRVSSLMRTKLSPPVIATTPGLSLPGAVQFDSYAKVQNGGGKKSAKPVLKDLILHSSAHKTIDFTGREDRLEHNDGLLRHYIGLFDPKTGDLQVVEARKVVVRGSVRAQQASAEAMGVLEEKQVAMALRTELGQAFGTKKAKRALADRVENAITTEAIQGSSSRSHEAGEAALMESLGETTASMPTREQLQAAVDGAKPVPKGNYQADQIEDVYDPEAIIGADVLSSIPIRDWQEAIKTGDAIHVHSRYVANRVRRVGEHEESVTRLRIIRYLYFLILFWIKAKAGKFGAVKRALPKEKLKSELAPTPEAVIESLRKKFTDHGDIRKPHVDLLMTTCCVLASIIDSFEVDTFDLREDLKLEQKQLNQYFHEIGARTKPVKSAERNTTIAKLALPLQFPKMRVQRRRK